MRWPDTCRRFALMGDIKAGENIAIGQDPGDTHGTLESALKMERTMAVTRDIGSPDPAGTRFTDFAPKPFFNGALHG